MGLQMCVCVCVVKTVERESETERGGHLGDVGAKWMVILQ
jgi:hypothetical protein